MFVRRERLNLRMYENAINIRASAVIFNVIMIEYPLNILPSRNNIVVCKQTKAKVDLSAEECC
jgi:hypothetical protein